MFTFSVALRFLTSKRSQTVLIILGIAIGISVNIFLGSLLTNLQGSLINQTVGSSPHVITTNNTSDELENYKQLEMDLNSYSEVKNIVSSLDERAFIMNVNPNNPDVILLRGMDLVAGNNVYKFFSEDRFNGTIPNGPNEIVIGVDLQQELGVSIGDNLIIKTDPNPIKTNHSQTITGIFDIGVAALNKIWVITNYNTSETITGKTGLISSINIQIFDVFQADSLGKKISSDLGNEYTVKNWKDENASLLNGISAQSSSGTIIEVFIILTLGVSIASILSITVLQKSRQMGILKAMGLSNRRSAEVFLWESLLIGFLGAFFGVFIALFMIIGFDRFAASKLTFTVTFDLAFTLLNVIIAILASFIAGIFPAQSSSKLEVIDIIREN
jgi:lipoprotein-releasing system permease protein